MFRNNYHPAFLTGGVIFLFGLSIFSFSLFLFSEVMLKYWDYDNNWQPQAEEWLFFLAITVGGIFTLISGIGIIKKKLIAKKMANFICFFCIGGGVILLCIFLSTEYKLKITEAFFAITFALSMGSPFLLAILILNGEESRKYFGEDKNDIHEDLLDSI